MIRPTCRHRFIQPGLAIAATVLAAALSASCTIGPQTLPRDRLGYADALARSAREEMLLNVVRIRYLESPIFLSINSVVNQYALETAVSAGASWNWGSDLVPGSSNTIGGAGRFSDRPTITYAPVIGKRFTEAYLTPMRPESLLALIESGWRVDGLFPLMVHSINGIRNRFYAGRARQELDLRFKRIVDCLSQMQDRGTLSIRVQQSADESKPSYVFIFSGDREQEDIDLVTELKQMLGLRSESVRYRIVFGSMARDDTEIAIVTRSFIAIVHRDHGGHVVVHPGSRGAHEGTPRESRCTARGRGSGVSAQRGVERG